MMATATARTSGSASARLARARRLLCRCRLPPGVRGGALGTKGRSTENTRRAVRRAAKETQGASGAVAVVVGAFGLVNG